MSSKQKYAWTFSSVDEWNKKQAKELSNKLGMKVSPAVVQKIIHDNVILPNNIVVTDLINTKKINKEKIRKLLW